jgi:hypothetical protein
MFLKKTVLVIGFDAKTVDFLMEHKRLMKIGVYMISILVYLTGLSPSINLYNGKTFAIYALSIIPILLISIILSMFSQYYVLVDLLLIPLAVYLLRQSYGKWDRIESSLF